MTSPPYRSASGRFRAPRPDPFALMAFAGALMIAVGFALIVARPGGGGASLGSSGGQQAFGAPVRVPANGEYVRSRVLASGDVAVDHWIRSTNLIYQLTLSIPPTLRTGGEQVRASQVKVASDGVTQFGPTTVTRRQVYHAQGASRLRVSYVLSGAVTRSGSTPHRALLRATSLDLAYTLDRGPRVVSVTGARVLAAACTPAGDKNTSAARPCGTAQGRAWRVSLGPDSRGDDVLAQLDLT